MDDSQIQLLEYITEDGENPFHKWLNSLKDLSARARIRVRLNRVRLGNFGDCKPVGMLEKVLMNYEWIMVQRISFIMENPRRPS